MRRGDGDIQKYVNERTGVNTTGRIDWRLDQLTRYGDGAPDEATGIARPVQLPPGFFAADTTSQTAMATNRTIARYLGQAPADLNLVTLRFSVLTAAVTITWAEVGIATSLDMTLGGQDLALAGYVTVASTFNSIGTKDVEVPVGIGRDEHVWAVYGSQATTPFQVLRGIGDGLGAGFVLFADATRPSTMANPTTFSVTSASANSAWIAFSW